VSGQSRFLQKYTGESVVVSGTSLSMSNFKTY